MMFIVLGAQKLWHWPWFEIDAKDCRFGVQTTLALVVI